MKRFLLLILTVMASVGIHAQKYFPEGTKWTEIRLDTLKYDDWYSKVGDEWVANYETVEYQVKGEYTAEEGEKYKCVYTNGPEWTDSLALMIKEESDNVLVSVLVSSGNQGKKQLMGPVLTYAFDWVVGKELYFQDFMSEALTSIVRYRSFYGIVDEIKNGNFGGVGQMDYADLDGRAPADNPDSPIKNIATRGCRMLQGVGVTEWNDGECLFGPSQPHEALRMAQDEDRHYRSMLVRFERGGEVLYDVWPARSDLGRIESVSHASSASDVLYDLQGRRISQPSKGLYIENGRKRVVR